ncbi:Protein N-acetyltransferase, RimJ/RimL family [Cribrihabitans marinus]|uniref:Protein N-acetyltransferase, RimJ/RimL family n=1 Tax=Cribrihabitans marinus TaxID=1227549 RepID=A0A1H7CYD3_9RHOB|nr:GNAT family N-acetyltransferase [Cribrihabitans marinus]GGH37080.1 N-acetyltransferase [Cribrihabitans marinus]SEJ94678.1 Protein N-acetyltransferase, RimJ/RimL family [Cribrihabitans marinus]
MTRLACETPSTGPAAALAAQLADRIPVLETRRLVLRAPRIVDVDAYAEIAASPRGRHLGCATRAAAWYDFSNMVAGWLLRGHGIWTVTARQDGALLGFVLLGFEPGDREPELGFMMTQAGEGHGYAAEAAEATRAYGFEHLNLPSLVSYIDPDNTRSIRLAGRLGALREGEITEGGETSVVFRHPRPDPAERGLQ